MKEIRAVQSRAHRNLLTHRDWEHIDWVKKPCHEPSEMVPQPGLTLEHSMA